MDLPGVRRCVVALGAAVLVFTSLTSVVTTPASAEDHDIPSSRLAGDNRYATAARIAQRSFPEGADVAYLARGDAFADALAAGTLTDGPILLTPPCGTLADVIREELDRLAPDRVVALGGEGAVCPDLLDEAAAGRTPDRLSGASRYDTAVAIAERAFPDGAPSVYLANGADSPDAVAGGALTDGPILLLPPDGGLLDVVTDAVQRLDPDRVVALGGPAVVTDDQLDGTAAERPTDRLFGPDRFATAVAIAREAQGSSAETIYLARGDLFADAVAAGSLVDGPVLLVRTCGDLPDGPGDYLANAAADEVIALGGNGAVCDGLLHGSARLPSPLAEAGTIVYERRQYKESIDRIVGELWARDADGSNPRLLAAANVDDPENVQDDISYTAPSLAGLGATDIVFQGEAIGHSATPPCPGTFCAVHFGFHVTGVMRWRDGEVERETPPPEYCFNCTTFFTHPTRTADGHWVAWYEHYQEGSIDYTNNRAVGTPAGEWEFTGNQPCDPVSTDLGSIVGHPLDPDVVAYIACTTDGNFDVFVSTRDDRKRLKVASVPVADDNYGNGLALGWTTLGELLVRVADPDALEDAGFWRYSPVTPADEQEPTLILREADGVVFGSPTQIVGGRLLFHVRDEHDPDVDDDTTWDLWTVPSDCEECSFPDDATRLTDDGRSRRPTFTGEHRLDLHH